MATNTMHGRAARGVLVALVAVTAGCALGPQLTRSDMQSLNRKALAHYEKGQLRSAKKALLEAVVMGKKRGFDRDPTMAETYAELGAVYVALKDRPRGVRHFALALRADPSVELPREMATPQSKRAFASARAALKKKGLLKEGSRPEAAPRPEVAERRDAPKEPKTPDKPKAQDRPAPAKREKPVAVAEKPVAVAAKPAPKPAAPPVPQEEPPPSDPPQPLYCPTPVEADAESDVALRCATGSGVRAQRVTLYYRAPGSEEFTAVKMTRSPKGWWNGAVPASATTGKSLQYYFEAQAAGSREPLTNGGPGSPNSMMIRGEDDRDDEDVDLREENPLEELERERREDAAEADRTRRGAGSIFVGVGAGSGWGWHPKRALDYRSNLDVDPGFSSGGLVSVMPEIGYQLREDFAISVQTRHQFIPEEGSGDLQMGHPERTAHAALVRLHWFKGAGNLQGFVTLAAGGGQGFRLVVPPDGGELVRNDTVRGGPVLAGSGAGFTYHFTRHLALSVEARVLLGVPYFAALGELGAGIVAAF